LFFLGSFNENHLEGLVGATYDLPGDAQLFAGAGVGLRKGYGTPDWRGLAGVRMDRQRPADSAASARPRAHPSDPAPPDPIPDPVPPIPEPPIEIGEVYFEFDRAEIEPGSLAVLDKVVGSSWLSTAPPPRESEPAVVATELTPRTAARAVLR
jgi:outer membrane protein OmpA-like peptidoglycan-associated protein